MLEFRTAGNSFLFILQATMRGNYVEVKTIMHRRCFQRDCMLVRGDTNQGNGTRTMAMRQCWFVETRTKAGDDGSWETNHGNGTRTMAMVTRPI